MTICCVTNDPYVRFTLALINSIRINCDVKYKIVCMCVNVSSENIEHIKSFDVEVVIVTKQLSTIKNMLTPDGTTLTPVWKRDKQYGSLISEEASYCSNSRFKLVAEHLTESTHVLFLDVDAIVRKDLREILSQYGDNDITIRKTENEGVAGRERRLTISEPENIIYQQGVFLVKSSKKTREFYTRLSELVLSDWKNWNADQIFFYHEIQKHDLKIGQLDSKYRDVATNPVDGGLKDSSYIWSGAWTDKYNNERYVGEYSKYKVI